jgi:hypothetical protein
MWFGSGSDCTVSVRISFPDLFSEELIIAPNIPFKARRNTLRVVRTAGLVEIKDSKPEECDRLVSKATVHAGEEAFVNA